MTIFELPKWSYTKIEKKWRVHLLTLPSQLSDDILDGL